MQEPTTTDAQTEPAEVEWQFDVADLDLIERWLRAPVPHGGLAASPGTRKTIVDSYVDSVELGLYAAGLVARLRTSNGTAEATVKSVASGGDAGSGLRRRLELNQSLPYALLFNLAESRGPVIDRIRQVMQPRALRVICTVRTDRRTWLLTIDGREVGEVALDDTLVEAGDELATLRRVEVEALTPDGERLLAPFVDVLRSAHRLRPGTISKFGIGLELARRAGIVDAIPEVAAPPLAAEPRTTPEHAETAPVAQVEAETPPAPAASESVIETTVEPAIEIEALPDGSLAALVREVLTKQLSIVRDHEAGTRLGENIEALHDMRVAVRRLRSALRLFRASLPSDVRAIDGELRWLGAELGVVRDLDVQLERVTEWRGVLETEDAEVLEPLTELFRRRREDARSAMLHALDSERLPALYRSLELLAATGAAGLPKQALEPGVERLPSVVGKQYRAFRSRARRAKQPDAPAELLHETRIRAKRLRYASEFSQEVYGRSAGRLVAELKRVQDVLGLHQDATVAIAELRTLAHDEADRLPAATLFAMGEVAERYRRSQQEQRDAFPEAQREVRRRWKQLARAMDVARRDLA